MRKRTYSEEQLNIVREYYPSGNWDHILPMFPNKSKADIRAIARKNGIFRQKKLKKDIDLTGVKFGDLTAISKEYDGRVAGWKCKCKCGRETNVSVYSLLQKKSKAVDA